MLCCNLCANFPFLSLSRWFCAVTLGGEKRVRVQLLDDMLHVISNNYWCSWDSPKIFLHTSGQHICLQILSAANIFSGSPLSSPYQISKVKLFMPVALHTFEVIIWLITIISLGYLIFSQDTFNMCYTLCQRFCQISKNIEVLPRGRLDKFFFRGGEFRDKSGEFRVRGR